MNLPLDQIPHDEQCGGKRDKDGDGTDNSLD